MTTLIVLILLMLIVARYLPKTRSTRRHGHTTSYQRQFNAIRPAILRRDGYRCRKCGSRNNLHIHHIKWRSRGGSNRAENLTTLCKPCHERIHGHKIF